jgi:hypothetical protein
MVRQVRVQTRAKKLATSARRLVVGAQNRVRFVPRARVRSATEPGSSPAHAHR